VKVERRRKVGSRRKVGLVKRRRKIGLIERKRKGIWCYKKKEVKRREIEKEWLYFSGSPNLHKRRRN
jgi:hypothetical protein